MIAFKLTDRHKQLAVKWLVRGVFVLVGWVLAVQPGLAKIKMNKSATQDIEERSRLIVEIHQLREKSRQFDASLSSEEGAHALLGKISKLASESRFDVQSLVPTTEPAGLYTKVRLDLTAQGSFASLYQFLKAFEDLKLSGAVVNLSVANDGKVVMIFLLPAGAIAGLGISESPMSMEVNSPSTLFPGIANSEIS